MRTRHGSRSTRYPSVATSRGAAVLLTGLLASLLAGPSISASVTTPVAEPSLEDVGVDTAGSLRTIKVVGGSSVVGDSVVADSAAITGVTPNRLSGGNRFATAVAVARDAFPRGVEQVYLATWENFADALAASNALVANDAALLLTRRDALPSETRAELQRLGPSSVTLIGGPGVIGEAVADELAQLVGSIPERLAGGDRYQTSVAVSAAAFPNGVGTVYIATGHNFVDALSASNALVGGGAALLLTPPDGLPDVVRTELRRLQPQRVFIIGGTAAVSDTVVEHVVEAVSVPPIRLAGANRFDTAARVVAHAFPAGAEQVYLATGRDFPDALAAAQAVLFRRAALLLTDTVAVPESIRIELARLAGTELPPLPGPLPGLLAQLVIAAIDTSVPYDRSAYPHWSGSCPNVRHRVLARDSEVTAVWREDGCLVISGRWTDPWTGLVYTLASEIDIDHHVPLANAHRSGAWAWDRERRRAFANDLEYRGSLRTMGASANRQKGDRGPETWRPPVRSSWCEYATDWATIKIRWSLTVTEPEFEALDEMLASC